MKEGPLFLLKLYTLKSTKIRVPDTSRLSLSRLFEDCCVFAHCVIKMSSRRMRKDAKMRKRSRLPSSVKTEKRKDDNCLFLLDVIT